MRRRSFCLLLTGLLLAAARPLLAADDGPIYELRVYTCEPGKLEALHERFRNHTTKLFEKHGMKNVAYWVPTDGPTAENTLIYILEHKSREAAQASWAAFLADPEWKEVARKSQQDHGKILTGMPTSTYMKATDYSAKTAPVDHSKVYELRTYVAKPGKFDAINARFRNHTDGFFKTHGMKVVGYWVPLDEPKSSNTLLYVVQHDSREKAAESWKAFGANPAWQAARKESEKDGPLLVGRPEAVYMKVVDYSPKAE
jgi:hypothetical protein